jgi:hypothetical protein
MGFEELWCLWLWVLPLPLLAIAVAIAVGSIGFEGWRGFGDDTALSAIPFKKLG